MLNKKNEFLSKRSIRDKLASYLLSEAEINGSLTFEIRLNRHELADFLCVDRSALSRELGNLRDEGIVSFNKNSFTITDLDSLTC